MRSHAAALLVVLLFGSVTHAEEAPQVTLAVQAERLSVSADGVPLQDVLTEFSRLTGIRIYLKSALDARVAEEATRVAYEGLTLEASLRRLLKGKNYLLVFSPVELTEVRIYVGGEEEFRRLASERRRQAQRPKSARKAHRQTRSTEEGDQGPLRLQREALTNPDPSERAAALDRLAGEDDQVLAIRTALAALERERNPEVLESALDVLQGGESLPLEPVIRFATSDREPHLRIHALEILSEHGPEEPRILALLRTLAESAQREDVREAAKNLLEDQDPH